jgi:hypothetical protein
MYLFVFVKISIYPDPELIKRRGSAINTHYVCNKTPNVSSHVTVKEQMYHTFKNVAEKTSFVTLPIFPAEVIFGQNSISIN